MAISDQLQTRTGSGNGRADLICPRCGESHLHHGKVVVFDRPEDAESVTLTTINSGAISMVISPSIVCGNPSLRRDGISIHFLCEICGEGQPIVMKLAQHKGQTEIFWEYED